MKFKLLKINKYEPAADEKRFEEFAAKGEFIKSYSAGIGCFKKGEPKKVKYCIEASIFRPNKKKRTAYAESGWKLAARGSDFNVYMSEDENAVPLHTDRSEYAHVIRDFHRGAKLLLIYLYIILALCILVPLILFPLMTGGIVQHFVTLTIDEWLIESIIRTMAVVLPFMFLMVAFCLHDYKTAGQFITGCIESEKSAEKAVSQSRLMTGIFAVLIILAVLNISFLVYCKAQASSREADFSEVPVQALTMEEIYGEGYFKYLLTDEDVKKYIDPELLIGTEKGYAPYAILYTSAVSSVHYDYWQSGAYIPDGKEYGIRTVLNGTYTEFKTEWLAKQCAEEFKKYEYFFFSDSKEQGTLDTVGTPFDSAEYIHIDSKHIYLVLRQGTKVHTVKVYTSEENVITLDDVFENILNSCE